MQLKSSPLLSAILLILVASFHYQALAISPSAIVGNWRPIPNVNDVLEIARFAVSEHNKKANVQLEFVKVVKGESQVVEGTNYRLVIIANDAAVGNAPGNYEAVVWDMPWKHFRELSSFVKV
ncbi:cysteine proteinase inhibitor 1-like [Primulina huaijiensis]|uniref:cysteine proteinase inhibitor 1-like n=1 Tax=Primulina huaijiensis TaxID=1492673 RepID=UPI003CC71F60